MLRASSPLRLFVIAQGVAATEARRSVGEVFANACWRVWIRINRSRLATRTLVKSETQARTRPLRLGRLPILALAGPTLT